MQEMRGSLKSNAAANDSEWHGHYAKLAAASPGPVNLERQAWLRPETDGRSKVTP
jgi:hypothetical protein